MQPRARCFPVLSVLLAACSAARAGFGLGVAPPVPPPALPSRWAATHLSWERVLFVHFSITTFTGSQNGTQDPSAFAPPADFSMDSWLDAAVAIGAKVAVLTSKHEAGFLLWHSSTVGRNFSILASPTVAHRDLIAEWGPACRARGIEPGLYFTTTDAWATAHLNSSEKSDVQIAQFNELTDGRYGQFAYFWFDHHSYGGQWEQIDDIVRLTQPDAVNSGVDTALIGGETGYAPYPNGNACFTGSPNGTSPLGRCVEFDLGAPVFKSLEVDCSAFDGCHPWFAGESGATKPMSVRTLMTLYETSVGAGAGLILNAPPNASGVVDDKLLTNLRGFGAELQRQYGAASLLGAATAVLAPGAALEVLLTNASTPFVRVWVAEDVAVNGERIAGFALDACTTAAGAEPPSAVCPHGWTPIPLNATRTGSLVGARTIVQLSPPLMASAVRLRLLATYEGLNANVTVRVHTGGASAEKRACAGAPMCGTILATAPGGVNVFSNGVLQCVANNNSAAACCGSVAGLNGCEYGAVELVQRWFQARFITPPIWPGVATPLDLCSHLPTGLTLVSTPVAGDVMVVAGAAVAPELSSAGIVVAVSAPFVTLLEQNGDVSGSYAYSLADAMCFISGQ